MQLTQTAADKRAGMTLAELGRLVQEAHRAGLDPDTAVVAARVGFRSQLQELTVKEQP